MATESFFQDMVIDTPEAAANLEALFDSGVFWTRGDTVFIHLTAEDLRREAAALRTGNRWVPAQGSA